MYLRAMNLAALDLNLLVALDALVAEAHVGRAASRIGLSQPATSHALRRLREIMGDPLLVRVGARMQLTPRAQSLRVPLTQALEQLRGLFVAEGFEPATSTRRFALMAPDLVVDVVVPPLLERIGALAPRIRLDVTPWRGPAIVTDEEMRSVDIVIACTPDAFAGFHRQRLYADSDMVAVRRGHRIGMRLRRLEAFLEARHVAVVGPGHREDLIDIWLRGLNLERRIALVVPSYLQALRMAARTDLVAFVPSRLIAALGGPEGLIAVPPPVDPGIDEQFMFHPTRAQVDPASIWLRGLIAEIGRGLDRPAKRAA
ncbi:transcriptional regulator, LysR family [Rhizobiales bacterium GAS191]|nr:transcriptional regulator, LysR family [Rhizobiales bacterium GAS113]SEC71504.1 transcriptional regulator, LysR family [Rhizobiales bacterium GAS191]